MVVRTTPSTRKTRQTYTRLVESARNDINRGGTLSPERVARGAGVAPATFYLYFQSKDEAIGAAFDQVLGDLNDRLAGSLTIEGLLDRGREAVLCDAFGQAVEGFRQDALVFRLALARLPERKVIRDIYRARESEALDLIQRFVELGISAGKIADREPWPMAAALLVILQGCNNHLLLRMSDGAVVDQLVDATNRLLAPSP